MFNNLQTAKRKVITFDDDGVPIQRQEPPKQSEKQPLKEEKQRLNQSNKSEAKGAEASTASIDTKQTTTPSSEPPLSSQSSQTTPKSSSTPSVSGEAKQTQHQKKRKHQFQDGAQGKKTALAEEPTTDAILQKSKELKKHRKALPIYSGMLRFFHFA